MSCRKLGQLATHEERFCPYAAVVKYPYRHLYGEASQVVSDNFFAHGAFREREWSLYYIRTKHDSIQKPLLLIPESEVESLFSEIRTTLDIQVAFPDVTSDPGFQLGFQEDGSPRPRYLGRLTTNCGVPELEEIIPVEGSSSEDAEEVDNSTLPSFRRKMDDAVSSGKNKSKQEKEKKRKDRIGFKKGWFAELKRAQCYLGLRPRRTASYDDFHKDPNMTWEESQRAQEEYEKAVGLSLQPVDLNVTAPYAFNREVVFVCIDIEAYERDQGKITEIGVSTLDTLDIAKIPPGTGGNSWMKYMRSRHFRVTETAHLANREFITGCADRFETRFGTSEWISIKEAPQVIAACFKHPFSAPGKYNPHPAKMRDVPRHGSNIQPLIETTLEEKRNIILLGHDIRSDIDYLRKIGYDVGNLSNVIEAIDTANIFRAYKHEQNPRNLGTVLHDFGIDCWNLHNAGNDAAYTMQALISIAIAAREPTNMSSRETPEAELPNAATEAKARIMEESEDWKAAEEEGGDGGEPIALLPATQMFDRMEFDRVMRKGRKADERNEIKNARRGTGFRGAGRSRGGGGGRGRGDRGVHAQQAKPEPRSMPFDFSALDESMGVTSGGGWDGQRDNSVDLTRSVNNNSSNGHQTTGSGRNTKNAARKEGCLPPHLHVLSNARAKEPLSTSPEAPNVVIPQITDRMANRLALLDDGW